MLESIWPLLRQHWPIALTLLTFAYFAKNRFTHGLEKYPGPFLASLTDWWRFFDVLGRRPDITHIRLHRELGDIVRLGPNVLSFADPNALKTIYGLNRGFLKVALKGLGEVGRVLMKTDWVLHRSNSHVQGRMASFAVLYYRRVVPCRTAKKCKQCLFHECTRTVRAISGRYHRKILGSDRSPVLFNERRV